MDNPEESQPTVDAPATTEAKPSRFVQRQEQLRNRQVTETGVVHDVFDPNQVGVEATPGEPGVQLPVEEARIETGIGGGGVGVEEKKESRRGLLSRFGIGNKGAMDTTGGGGFKEGYHPEEKTAQSGQVADEKQRTVLHGAPIKP